MSNRSSVAAMDSELRVAANVSSARPLGRRFLVELNALTLVQLVEAPLYGTSMEKPLLSAVVANEPEPAVTNESLDSAGRHPSLLGRAHVCPKAALQDSFHLSV
jgi:hypothetical protein